MPLRDKFERPLRAAIRQKLQDGEDSRLSRFLFAPLKLARLCAQVEIIAASHGASGKLDAWEVGDERSQGFRTYFDWIIEHWAEILQLAFLILNLVGHDADGEAGEVQS